MTTAIANHADERLVLAWRRLVERACDELIEAFEKQVYAAQVTRTGAGGAVVGVSPAGNVAFIDNGPPIAG